MQNKNSDRQLFFPLFHHAADQIRLNIQKLRQNLERISS